VHVTAICTIRMNDDGCPEVALSGVTRLASSRRNHDLPLTFVSYPRERDGTLFRRNVRRPRRNAFLERAITYRVCARDAREPSRAAPLRSAPHHLSLGFDSTEHASCDRTPSPRPISARLADREKEKEGIQGAKSATERHYDSGLTLASRS